MAVSRSIQPRGMDFNSRVDITVDADDLKKIAKTLKKLAYDQKQWVLKNALNDTGNQTNTEITDKVYDNSGLKIQAIRKRMRKKTAVNSRLEYSVTGYGKGIKVTAGKGAKGNFQNAKWSRKWSGARWSGETGGKAHTFMVLKTGRDTYHQYGKGKKAKQMKAGVVMERKGRGRLPIRVVYDDGVAVEMQRLNLRQIAQKKMDTVFVRRVFHHADQGLKHAKRKYGL